MSDENQLQKFGPGDRSAQPGKLILRSGDNLEIEIPLDEVFYGERRADPGEPRHAARKARTFLCGNCGERMPLTGDATEDHHTAQRHKLESCRKTGAAKLEHAELLATDSERRRELQAREPRLLLTGYGFIERPKIGLWRWLKNFFTWK